MIDAATYCTVLRTPWAGPWRRFRRPSRIVVAVAPGEVPDALRAVDEAVRGGSYAAGFVTYEAAAAFGLAVHEDAGALPLVCFGLFPPEDVETLSRFPASGAYEAGVWEPSIDHDSYLKGIRSIKDRIEQGDTYQINFTFRLLAHFKGDVTALMREMHAGQAGAWSGYVDLGRHAICSASPELFFRLEQHRLECRPMKGTAPRGLWPEQDDSFAEALRVSAKNRAENVMIVDMVRNDLGRIARVGSVSAPSLFDVERYPLQWQMTSTVTARAATTSLAGIFEAMFPSGSVTGAPKHSAMAIIRELEATPRRIYTGAIGYVSPQGRAHFNVAIRTVLVDRESGTAEMGIGSGVVWDSVDRDEYDECLLKAGPLVHRPSRTERVSYAIADPPGFRLLESLLWTPVEGFVLLDRHLQRLAASARCWAFPCDVAQIRAMLAESVRDLRGPAKVRVMLESDGSILCEAGDLTPIVGPLRVAFADEAVDADDVFLYHKTTRRGVYERARSAHPEADAVVLWNTVGDVTEATDANVVMIRDGTKITPPVASGLLPGVMRAELLARSEIVEATIARDEFLAAPEKWLVNSVRGWMPVTF